MGYRAGPPGSLGVGATNIGAHSGFSLGGNYSTAIGGSASIGSQSYAAGTYSIAIGGGDGASFTPSTGDIVIQLIGARASGFVSMAIGTAALASGGGSSAFGLYSRATGDDSAAYGEFSTASGARSIAMGLFSEARATTAIAIGTEATATRSGAIAIGNRSVANVANTVSVGSKRIRRRIVNVASAVDPTDAVTLAQVQAMLAAAIRQKSPADAVRIVPTEPATSASGSSDKDIRRELADLRALLRQQQRLLEQQQALMDQQQLRIARLEGNKASR